MADDLVGRTLGRYQLRALVGQGGMAAVYRALDPVLSRDVAVKVMHGYLAADPAFVGRFKEEAQAVAALRHPNIVRLFDFGSEDGRYFMVMEYVGGPTLASLLGQIRAAGGLGDDLPSRRLSPTEILAIFLPLCSAVDYAASRGMVHRDIKPANILLTAEEEPVLTDYGIARLMTSAKQSVAGFVMGSAHYMSPEQIRGLPTDHRSDIYSLGAVIFEALAGRAVYEAETTAAIMAQHVSAPVPFVRTIDPDLPDDVQHVLETALAKDPRRRFQRATDMGAALHLALAGVALEAGAAIGSGSIAVASLASDAVVAEPTLTFDNRDPAVLYASRSCSRELPNSGR